MDEPVPPQAVPRVGVDLVRVRDIVDSISTFGDRYLRRVFTHRELADSLGAAGTPDGEHLAARFAAKEAALKVLRPIRHWFDWRQIEIVRDPGGWVGLELHGAARAHAQAQGLARFSLSLSHENDHAIAVVLGSS